MNRIAKTFDSLDRPALVTFITAGDPDRERSLEILKFLPEAGADVIELGMPFTDPVADGPTIQAASERALNAGADMHKTLNMVREFRVDNDHTPIILMGYMNPIHHYGLEAFTKDATAAGVDGLIIVDLPPEEDATLQSHAKTYGLCLIRLVTPTTSEERLTRLLDGASGFLYYVSITGVTGAAKATPSDIAPHIEAIKAKSDLPVCVGFGIKTPEDAAAMGGIADGVVVGSVLVNEIADGPHTKGLAEKITKKTAMLSTALKTQKASAA